MFGKDCALIGCNMYFLGLFWLCRFGAVLGVCLTWDRYVEWIFALSRREALKICFIYFRSSIHSDLATVRTEPMPMRVPYHAQS